MLHGQPGISERKNHPWIFLFLRVLTPLIWISVASLLLLLSKFVKRSYNSMHLLFIYSVFHIIANTFSSLIPCFDYEYSILFLLWTSTLHDVVLLLQIFVCTLVLHSRFHGIFVFPGYLFSGWLVGVPMIFTSIPAVPMVLDRSHLPPPNQVSFSERHILSSSQTVLRELWHLALLTLLILPLFCVFYAPQFRPWDSAPCLANFHCPWCGHCCARIRLLSWLALGGCFCGDFAFCSDFRVVFARFVQIFCIGNPTS